MYMYIKDIPHKNGQVNRSLSSVGDQTLTKPHRSLSLSGVVLFSLFKFICSPFWRCFLVTLVEDSKIKPEQEKWFCALLDLQTRAEKWFCAPSVFFLITLVETSTELSSHNKRIHRFFFFLNFSALWWITAAYSARLAGGQLELLTMADIQILFWIKFYQWVTVY